MIYTGYKDKFEAGDITIYLADCNLMMPQIPDKYYQLALVDPPYGINRDEGFKGFKGFGGFGEPIARKKYKSWNDSDIPTKEYFDELLRVSEKVLIFGGNFFTHLLPVGKHWIVWDKLNTMPTFGDCELLWTNISRNSVKKYTVQWNGLLGKEKTPRIHATQKPVKLYRKILEDYAKPGDRILDTHGGSCSLAIACDIMGYSADIFEIDEDYYKAACERLKRHQDQLKLEL